MTGLGYPRRHHPAVRVAIHCSTIVTLALVSFPAVRPAAASHAAGSSPTPATAQQSPEALIAQSQAAVRAYDYQAALQAAEQALAMAPLNIEANALLRQAHRALGTAATLVARYRSLLQQFPDSAAANYLLSTAFPDRDLSEAYLLEALRLDPTFGPAVQTMAQRKARGRNSDEGLEWGRRAMELMPGDPAAVRSYVTALQQHGRRQEAVNLLRQMTAQYPNELDYWTQLWRAELDATSRRNRNYGPLLDRINAQRFRFMSSMVDMERLAGVLRSMGPEGSAMSADLWVQIARRYPEHPRAERALISAASTAPDVRRKIEILDQLLELYPDSPAIYRALENGIQQLIRAEQFDEAIDLSRSLLDAADPGFDPEGLGCDSYVSNTSWGLSLVCTGHVGWFSAAQAKSSGDGRFRPPSLGVVYNGAVGIVRSLRTIVPIISPEAAAAAQSMLESSCRERGPVLAVGIWLASGASYRALGIRLIERALSLPSRRLGPGPEYDFVAAMELESALGALLDLYLQEGRLDDAVDVADKLSTGAQEPPLQRETQGVIARAYAAAGRVDEAKAHYLRALRSSRSGAATREELARLYRETSSSEIVRFEREGAPKIAPRGVVLGHADHDVRLSLARLLESDLAVLHVWSNEFPPSRENVSGLARIAEAVEDGRVMTLSINVARNAITARRAIQREPVAGRAAVGAIDALEPLSVTELPTTLLIDSSGRILARQMSFEVAPQAWLEAWIDVVRQELARLPQ